MTALPITDIEQAVYDRQRATARMVAACRRIGAHDDAVLSVANLTPDGAGVVHLTPAEQEIAAAWERRSDAAIAEIRAEHERLRAAMRREGSR